MTKLRLAPGGLPANYQKVAAIKAVRQLSGLSLKEAKDAVEAAAEGELINLGDNLPSVTLISSYEEHKILLEQGLELIQDTSKVNFIITAIKESAKLATDEGEEELAVLLLDVVCQHKENVEQREKRLETQREIARERKHSESIRKDEVSVIRERQEEIWEKNRERSRRRDQEEREAATDRRI